jgi:formate hydrogenlyase subunit 3/multisubunit Na+/H+ antiporter MnhD subunit
MNLSVGNVLLAAAPIVPIALIAAWLLPSLRERLPVLSIVAPMPALAASLFALGGSAVTFWRGLVPITLALDAPGAMLLAVSSLLWIVAAIYAAMEGRSGPAGCQFTICWLLTLAGSIGVFVAGDLASFFLAYTLVSIPAYGLIVCDDTLPVRRAGVIYMAYAILGETILLMAFALLAAAVPGNGLSIGDAQAALPGSPFRGVTVALLIVGFGMKIALVPLHTWMPPTYRAAPVPAAAVLSGAGVKAGVIGLIRFLPLDTVIPGAGVVLTAAGFFGAFYGVVVGITRANPKSVLAYSSISQMGLIVAVLGMGLTAGGSGVGTVVAFYAAHHVLVKGALFLAVGLAATAASRRPLLVLFPALVLALSLGGLPLTGGAVVKLALKEPLGNGFVALLGNLSAAGSTVLMLHFMRRLVANPAPKRQKPRRPGSWVFGWRWQPLRSLSLGFSILWSTGRPARRRLRRGRFGLRPGPFCSARCWQVCCINWAIAFYIHATVTTLQEQMGISSLQPPSAKRWRAWKAASGSGPCRARRFCCRRSCLASQCWQPVDPSSVG